jgi:outer membrane protein OmpA-like peptidoglycan-associated protein
MEKGGDKYMIKRTIAILVLIGVVVFVFGCAGNIRVARVKNTLQRAPVANCPWEKCTEMRADWNRIAGMTDAEICKVLKCPGTVEIKEVIKEVPGPERIVEKEVIKEVPVEKVVVKEVPVEKVVKPICILPDELFDFDKSTLRPAGKISLDNAAKTLSDMGYPAVTVAGHTDWVGTEAYNMTLSLQRADSVMKYLQEKGVPADKMIVQGFSENRPIATNETAAGRQLNRRVEVCLANP